jgi:phosphohistidine swiveling domain-containing protein
MIESESAGTALSIDPTSADSEHLLIEAAWGLGEAVGSGAITPNSFVVDKRTCNVIQYAEATTHRILQSAESGGVEWRNLAPKPRPPVLTDTQIRQLSELIVKIEENYGSPQEVEWAYAHSRFHILQSRPVTTAYPVSGNLPTLSTRLVSSTILAGGGRAAYFYPHFCIAHMYSVEHDQWPLSVPSVADFKNHYVRWHTVPTTYEDFEGYLNRFVDDETLVARLETYITSIRDAVVSALSSSNVAELSSRNLGELAYRYYAGFEDLLRAAGTVRCVDRAMVPRLRALFQGSADVDELVRLASVDANPSFVGQEYRALLKLAITADQERLDSSSSYIISEIESIMRDYCWSSCGYYDEPARSRLDYLAKIQDLLGRDPSRLLSTMNERVADEIGKREDVFADLDPQSRMLTELARSSSRLKDYFKYSINKIIYFSDSLFSEIGRRVNLDGTIIKDLAPGEIPSLLQGDRINWEAIEDRMRHNIIVSSPGQFDMLIGRDAAIFQNQYLTVRPSSTNSYRGRVASRGYGWGRIRVVLTRSDLGKVADGDVVVVSNITPDLMPILHQGVSIVAEEGGVTSHAAVVSREFGLPCVVGIVNATSLFRDGDFAEVDAEGGTVTLIERSRASYTA